MVSSQNSQPEPSRTAQITRDTVGLGRTPGQRGAEVIAGIRAELTRSPEAAALCRTGGRIFARVLIRLGQSRDIFQFIPARMEAMSAMIGRSIPKDKPDPLIVEIASGFSPRPLHIAREFPQATVIEVDLPDVVAEKQRRLKYGGIPIPANLGWLTADLGVSNLADVLGGRKADLISAEGLTLYFSPEEIMRMNRHLRASLVEGGVYITEIYYREKFAEARQLPNLNSAISYFLRQAGNIPGLAADDAMARTWFTEIGFDPVESYHMPQIFTEIGARTPLLDIAAIIVAHNGVRVGAEGANAPSIETPLQPPMTFTDQPAKQPDAEA
jgi:O-methyltransferase involved in polyketide biosynthesis